MLLCSLRSVATGGNGFRLIQKCSISGRDYSTMRIDYKYEYRNINECRLVRTKWSISFVLVYGGNFQIGNLQTQFGISLFQMAEILGRPSYRCVWAKFVSGSQALLHAQVGRLCKLPFFV